MPLTNVLIVEDERIIAKALEKRLKGLGYTVAGLAANGEDGVRDALALRPDIVLMDISLGTGMDGIDAAEQVRNQADIPIVYMTAYSDSATLDRAKLTGPFGYVLKPYDDKDLQTAIEIGIYRHRMDQKIRENEKWLAATLGSIGDGVVAIDGQGQVRFLNLLAEQMTGWSQSEATGKDIRDIFHILHEQSRESVPNPALEALALGEIATLPTDTILISRDGSERPIDDCAAPIRDMYGVVEGSVLVFRDVSDRRRLEEHLRQDQKMDAIGRLAGGIAHDFNNIMTVIINYCQVLRMNGNLDSVDRDRYLDSINDAGQRAAGLTKQILAFSRKQMLVPTVLSLDAYVRDFVKIVRRLIGENITLVLESVDDLGLVKADPTQIGQVILNLAVNARDAMPLGGRLTVTTANVELDERFTRNYSDVLPGRYVMLSVSDTGGGMHPDIQAHIFEPFFTTKEVGKGTGLGLATVHGIVKQSGGHVEFESIVGVGTTFRVYLQRIEESPQIKCDKVTMHDLRGTEVVLLVEDEEPVRNVTKLILQSYGYTVLEASDGTKGVEISRDYVGTIHLVLTDLMMPNMSGRQLVEAIAVSRPGVRVIFMSGYAEDILVHQGEKSSVADFLNKPFTLEGIGKKVREVLDRP